MPTGPARFEWDDGGGPPDRPESDCAPRAIAIATGAPYLRVVDELRELARETYAGARQAPPQILSAEWRGTPMAVLQMYLRARGWTWRASGPPLAKLPRGKLIVDASLLIPDPRNGAQPGRHVFALIDRVIRDELTTWPAMLERANRHVDVLGYWSTP